jgi:hypothetical protein
MNFICCSLTPTNFSYIIFFGDSKNYKRDKRGKLEFFSNWAYCVIFKFITTQMVRTPSVLPRSALKCCQNYSEMISILTRKLLQIAQLNGIEWVREWNPYPFSHFEFLCVWKTRERKNFKLFLFHINFNVCCWSFFCTLVKMPEYESELWKMCVGGILVLFMPTREALYEFIFLRLWR